MQGLLECSKADLNAWIIYTKSPRVCFAKILWSSGGYWVLLCIVVFNYWKWVWQTDTVCVGTNSAGRTALREKYRENSTVVFIMAAKTDANLKDRSTENTSE